MSRARKILRRRPASKKKPKKAGVKAKKSAKPKQPASLKQLLPDGNFVASVLTASDREAEPHRIGSKWIHVSSLVNSECLRLLQLAAQNQIVGQTKPRSSDRLLWAIGKAVEKHIRDSLIRKVGRARAYGRWSCRCKNLQYEGFGTDEVCESCGELATEYDEALLQDAASSISGSPDLLLNVGTAESPVLFVIEIKSIKVVPKGGVRTAAPDFHNLESPSRSHALQALSYRELLVRLGFEVSDDVCVFYAAKDYVTGCAYKPFNVDGREDHNAFTIDSLFELGEQYTNKLGSSELMPRCTECVSPTSPRARSCPACAHCFARD